MSSEKHYYVIYKKVPTVSYKFWGESRQYFCIVEDEEIAKDFCNKNGGFGYFEEAVESNSHEYERQVLFLLRLWRSRGRMNGEDLWKNKKEF